MKKILAVVLVICTIGLGSAFAAKETEFDFTFNIAPTHKFTQKEDLRISGISISTENIFKEGCAIGLGLQWNWVFGSPKKWIDIGLNFDWNEDVFFKGKTRTKASGGGYSSDSGWADRDLFGYNLDFILGPMLRFNLGKRNSFLLSPGFKFSFGFAEYNHFEDLYLILTPQFNLDLGYRFWFSDVFGLCFDADLAWGKGSFRGTDINDFEKQKLDKSFAATIHIGISIRKGHNSGNGKAAKNDDAESTSNSDSEKKEKEAKSSSSSSNKSSKGGASSDIQQAENDLEKLKEMHDKGLITDDEYKRMRAKALGI